jgi:AAA+ ATPase superfamily predicted ATPase
MQRKLIGRTREKAILEKAYQSNQPEMIAVIGRRRVGKTFLVKTVYAEKIDFSITGVQNATRDEQLKNFKFELERVADNFLPIQQPDSWMDAFILLIKYLEKTAVKDKKQVVFFDELPWLSTSKSGFLRALSFFWNSWAIDRNIVVVICGSAASWMIQKVVNDKGGLHNRITKQLTVNPFNLAETEHFLNEIGWHFDRYQALELYMAMGGIPHYLKEVEADKSAVQNIDKICFSQDGILRKEFSRLYPALFDNSEKHILIIRALAAKPNGITRADILVATGLANGGSLTRILNELEESGFISKYFPYGKKKKDLLFRLTDEYSLFYLKFIENKVHEEESVWQKLSQTQSYKAWSGYAFENICLKHVAQIKKALEIGGIYSQSGSFYLKGDAENAGAQIDLFIDRNDRVINLCEIKFYQEEFVISKEYAQQLRRKMSVFREVTKTKKHLNFVFITVFGIRKNAHSGGLVTGELTVDDLFV